MNCVIMLFRVGRCRSVQGGATRPGVRPVRAAPSPALCPPGAAEDLGAVCPGRGRASAGAGAGRLQGPGPDASLHSPHSRPSSPKPRVRFGRPPLRPYLEPPQSAGRGAGGRGTRALGDVRGLGRLRAGRAQGRWAVRSGR